MVVYICLREQIKRATNAAPIFRRRRANEKLIFNKVKSTKYPKIISIVDKKYYNTILSWTIYELEAEQMTLIICLIIVSMELA